MLRFLLCLFFPMLFLVSCNNKEDDPVPETPQSSNSNTYFKKYTVKDATGSIVFQQECKYDDKARLIELLQTYNNQLEYKYLLEYNAEGLLGVFTIKSLPKDQLGVLIEGTETKYLYEYQDGLVTRISIQPALSVPSLQYEYTYQGKSLKTFKAVNQALLYEYMGYNAGGRPSERRQYRIKNDSLLLIGKRSYTYDANNNLIEQTNLDSLTTQPRERRFLTTFNTEKQVDIVPYTNLLPSTSIIYGASEDVNKESKDKNRNLFLHSEDLYRMRCTGTPAETYVKGSVTETLDHVFDQYNRLVSCRTALTGYDYNYNDCSTTAGAKREEYVTIEY